MRHRTVSYTDKNDMLLSYNSFNTFDDNSRQRREMKRLLKKAINNELTERQRYCLCEYYLNSRSMKSIAGELGVNPSTVTRHIQNARRRLKRIARYYQ